MWINNWFRDRKEGNQETDLHQLAKKLNETLREVRRLEKKLKRQDTQLRKRMNRAAERGLERISTGPNSLVPQSRDSGNGSGNLHPLVEQYDGKPNTLCQITESTLAAANSLAPGASFKMQASDRQVFTSPHSGRVERQVTVNIEASCKPLPDDNSSDDIVIDHDSGRRWKPRSNYVTIS